MTDLETNPSSEPIHLKVDSLPSDVAAQLREAQNEDPEFLRRILLYGVTHRAVFETLKESWTT